MECSQQHTTVAATVTLYENFLEEKCEHDLLIPDYYPAAEKIIQCSASPSITKKEIEGDRLNLEGICRICVLYQGEEEGDIKSLNESVSFMESLPLKGAGKNAWVQAAVRVAGTSCRLLNQRKISVKANVAVAVKVKEQQMTQTVEEVDCNEAEALFLPASVYTVLEHSADTTKIQGEIEVHSDVQDVLKTDGAVCIKDVRVLPGKAVIKGILNLFILYTREEDPKRVESTSTAIPFSQILELRQTEERGQMEVSSCIQNFRTDVESDENGKNRIISVSATILTEGELFENQSHKMLLDAYSNHYPIQLEKESLFFEELTESAEGSETLHHKISMESEGLEVVQVIGAPVIQKISGHDKSISIEGILDVSLFLCDDGQFRSIDKSLSFTLSVLLDQLDGQMRCEIHPCILGMNWSVGAEGIDLNTEIGYSITTFTRRKQDVICSVEVDLDHPQENDGGKPLVVYYGEEGERLWDIARRYATSVQALKSANDLQTDILEEKKLLLIAKP